MKKQRGSVLVEGALTLSLITIAIIIQLEMVRRTWVSSVLQLSAFQHVRNTMLGFSNSQIEEKSEKTLNQLFPFVVQNSKTNDSQQIHLIKRRPKNLEAWFHVRYPSFLKLGESGVVKKNYEVTELCRFPFSLYP